MQVQLLNNATEKSFRMHLFVLSVALLLLGFLANRYIHVDLIGWNHGFSHPLEGWDHLLTMLAVGIWAAQMRGHAIWMLPLAFVSVMSLGGLAGAAGLSIPSAEGIILLSSAVFVVLITRKIRFSTKINVLIVAFFAFFHGFAHGQEISASASLISYTLGFMVATLLLHGAGILVAKLVVFCIACLLTMIFSQLNPSAEINSASYGNARITEPSAENNNLLRLKPSQWHSVQDEFENGYSLGVVPLDNSKSSTAITKISLNDSETQSIDSSKSIFTLSNQYYTSDYKADKQFDDLSHGKPQVPNTVETLSFFAGFQTLLELVGFNQIYPSINNSPGVSFLSNGVGNNSPPVPNDPLLTLPATSSSKTSNNRLIEDPSLQLRITKSQQANTAPLNLAVYWLSFAFYLVIGFVRLILAGLWLNTQSARLASSLANTHSLIPKTAGKLFWVFPARYKISSTLASTEWLQFSKTPSTNTLNLSQLHLFLDLSLYHQNGSSYA
jgi:urease accessory protein